MSFFQIRLKPVISVRKVSIAISTTHPTGSVDWQKFISTMESEAKKRSAPVFTLKDFLKTPFQHLVFAVLSSRTRDEQTAKVAKKLFERVKKPEDLATMPVEEIERLIRGVGFYRVKARKLKELAKVLVEMGSVPDTYDELVKLPGVGRKTANVVLASAFGKAAIGVDTHVHRVSNRMGLVRTKKPEETENELKKIIPRELWTRVNRAMVGFGQTVCRPLKPLCDECPFTDWCPKNGVKKG